jgi:DNA-binding transcriptional regulator YdaS (Cro superfamily)
MKTPKDIVSALGGTSKTAALLGLSPQAVSNWLARGNVPLAHTARIVSAARDKGVKISYQDLLE